MPRGPWLGLLVCAAVAGIKCSRLGGSAGAPARAEVEALLVGGAAAATGGAAAGGPNGLALE